MLEQEGIEIALSRHSLKKGSEREMRGWQAFRDVSAIAAAKSEHYFLV